MHMRHEITYEVGDVVQARSKEGRYSEVWVHPTQRKI